MAADAHGALLGAAGPDWLEVNANGRKNRNMQYGDDVFRELFGLFHFESHTTKTQVQDAGATRTIIADDGISVGARHRDAFCLSLHGVSAGARGLRNSLTGKRFGGRGRGLFEFGDHRFLGSASGGDGNRSVGLRGSGRRRDGLRARRSSFGGARVIGVLQTIEALVGDTN